MNIKRFRLYAKDKRNVYPQSLKSQVSSPKSQVSSSKS